MPIKIKNAIPEALADASLQRNLKRTLSQSLHSRSEAVAEVPNWEDLRNYARQVKLHTLDHLGRYLEEFETRAKENGCRVLWAEDAEEACRMVLDIASEHGVEKVVKSKTMLGEEIEINQALEDAGIAAVETDLGEYIVQLCGEMPSHIVTPALHKSKEEVSRLFSEKLGMEPSEDVAELTATARRVLRHEFLEAGMGITGVNFGVAESGEILIVENEGNARLSMSTPRIHVALMGIEKLIPRRKDLPVFLKLLTRSATGQKVTSYLNWIQGPRRQDEADGPDEMYIVLIDNGRSSVLADPELRQTLACIRCGICLNVCPVFQTIGGHAYRSVYQGPIGAILTPQLLSIEAAPEHPFASSLCGACEEACPVKIEIPHILLKLRGRLQNTVPAEGERRWEAWSMKLWAWVLSSPGRYDFFSRWARRAARLGIRDGELRWKLPPLSHWAEKRSVPRPPSRSLREILKREAS